jgi:hypothetical protein
LEVFVIKCSFQFLVLGLFGLFWVSPASGQTTLFSQNFNDNAAGNYTQSLWRGDFPTAIWEAGIDEYMAYSSSLSYTTPRSLKISYPIGKYGPTSSTTVGGGVQWPMTIAAQEEATVQYRIRFADDFDFQNGGKLPGLCGKDYPTGGTPANGYNGFSARIMWEAGGNVSQYVYHVGQSSNYGDHWYWKTNSGNGTNIVLYPNTWYTVKTRIKMNTPSKYNGVCESWLDGVRVLNKTSVRWRDTYDVKIDKFYFSTFYGGGDSSYAPNQKAENGTVNPYINFDDIIITKP